MEPLPNIYRLIPLTPNIASDDGAARLSDWVFETAAKEYVRRARGAHDGAAQVTTLVSITRRLNALEFHLVCARPRMLATFEGVLDSIAGFGDVDWIREGRAQPYRARIARLERWIPYGLTPDTSLDWRCLIAVDHRFPSPLTRMSTDELLWFLGKVANRSPVQLTGAGAVSHEPAEHRLLRLLNRTDRLEAVDEVLARVKVFNERPQFWVLGPPICTESVAV